MQGLGIPVDEYLDKILLLEQKLHSKNDHKIIDSSNFYSTSSYDIQTVAKTIALSLGLSNLTFLITYAKQNTHQAGHIELNNSSEVFIEIDSDYTDNREMILAVLSHELCHKYLQINNISLKGKDNEILTDIATIYTGLGKLSLNGCEYSKESIEYEADHTLHKKQIKKVGYLSRHEFAFVYRLICSMRRIDDYKMREGLNESSINAINRIDTFYSKYFDNTFFDNQKAINELVNNATLEKAQIQLAELHKLLKIFESKILFHAKNSYSEFHMYSKDRFDALKEMIQSSKGESHSYLFRRRSPIPAGRPPAAASPGSRAVPRPWARLLFPRRPHRRSPGCHRCPPYRLRWPC